MKFLKIFFITIIFIVVAIVLLLESSTILNRAIDYGIKKSNLDIKISKISGGVFSGLDIKKINYQNQIKADLKIDIDFLPLKDGIIKINTINLSNVYIDQEFLKSLSNKESNQTKDQNQTNQFIKKIVINNLHIDLHDITFDEYILNLAILEIKNFSFDMKDDFKGVINLKIDSNVADTTSTINLKDKRYHVKALISSKKEFLKRFIKDSNLTLLQNPTFDIKADGDMQNVKLNLITKETKIEYSNIKTAIKQLSLNADYGIKSGNLIANLQTNIDSNLANLNLLAKSSLNINDINNTLKFQTITNLTPSDTILNEQNITSQTPLKLTIQADGNLTIIDIYSSLDEANLTYDKFRITPKELNLKARYHVAKQDINATLNTKIDSNITDLNLTGDFRVNLKDLNQTLKYNSLAQISINQNFLTSITKDQNLTIKNLSPFSIDLVGDSVKINTDFSFDANLIYNDIKIKSKIKNSNIKYNLKNSLLNAKLKADISSNLAKIALNSKAYLNAKDINNTLKYNTTISVSDTKPYQNIDLSTLGDIGLDIKGTLKTLQANLNSKKIDLNIKSDDFDKFDLSLNAKNLHIQKIYDNLPKEIKDIFLTMQTDGYYKISSNEINFDINTDANNLKLKAKVKKVDDKISLSLKNNSFYTNSKIELNPLKVYADGEISSIKDLLTNIQRVYHVDDLDVDANINFKVDTKDDIIKTDIKSPQIKIDQITLNDLNLLALYQPNRVVLKKFDLQIDGFESKDLNKKIALKKDAILTFDKQNANIDLELINLLSLKATKQNDLITASLKTSNLALSYPEYGSTKLTTDMEVYKSDTKLAVTGNIQFKETQIEYESRYLDVSKDSDILIVSKKSKEQEKKLKNNSFVDNTFLDINIKSSDNMLYKVKSGEIEFLPDIEVRKDFGSNLKLTGKIKLIDGAYDFADKRFKIDEGAIAFRGLEDINPLLDLKVTYDEIEDTLIIIQILGDKNRPKLIFSSKPMMSKKDIFSSLLFGMSADEIKNAATSANKAAEKIFARAIAQDLARELKLDKLDMNRNSDGGLDILAGKKVGKKHILYYKNKATKSSIIIEKKLSKHWSASTEIGKDGQGVDFVYRKWFDNFPSFLGF